jgi:hypothetical protein
VNPALTDSGALSKPAMKDIERHIFPRMAFSVSAGWLGSRGRKMDYPEEKLFKTKYRVGDGRH